ncbi:MAG: SDR family NAD(P)-dependent oxidoreductase [Phycisphaerales bacterium]|nr:SDR family NAD(P)-dependent oxidoreductase [Phycisphaerales bacterium]
MQSPIAIVGMAAMFPKAPDLKGYWRLLRRSVDAMTEIPDSHWRPEDYFDADPKAPDMTHCKRGAFLSAVEFDPTEFGIPPSVLEATDTAQLLGLLAARDALADAGYGADGRSFDRTRASVILGVTGTLELVVPLGARLGHPHWRRALRDAGVDETTAHDVMRRISDAYVGWQENSFPGLLGNVVAGRIANRLDLKGTNCVVDAACASSLSAVHLATLELQTGKSDLVLTGGVDTFNDIFMYMCFSKTQALSACGDARPFSAHADGTVLGEGVGIVALKRLADAERDGDHIYAVLKGIGTSSDGRSQSIYAPRAAGQAEALRDAYERAGVTPEDIGLVEAHGTGTRVGDAVEFEALDAVYRDANPEGTWCALGSVKSQIGHTKAAAGAASLIKAAIALHTRTLPAVIKVENPNPKMDVATSPFYLNTQTRPWFAKDGKPRRAGVSSFGFGGSNFHAVLEEYRKGVTPDEPQWDGSAEIVALSAGTRDALASKLAELRNACKESSLAELADASRRSFNANATHRLVMVIAIDDDAVAVFGRADRALNGEAVGDGVYYGVGEATGSVALLFPGQGSQYVGMGRDLACCFPEVHDAIASADAVSEEDALAECIFPPPTFDDAERREHETRLTATQIAQPAIGAVSLGMLRVLERFGVTPAVVCGHSFGELVALRAAGRVDDATLRLLSMRRGAAMAHDGEESGTMAAVSAPLAELATFLREKYGDVVLANRNAPGQGVVSGATDAVRRVVEACAKRGWRAVPLKVSRAFHSALMTPAQKQFASDLEHAEFSTGACPVLANVTADVYPDDAEAARALLARQIIEPVRFTEQIAQMYVDGVRTFVEVGPRAVLSGLVRQILDDEPHVAIALDASLGRGDGMVDLAKALAQLAALGHAVDLASWEKYVPPVRRPKMRIPIHGSNYRAPREPIPPVSAAKAAKPAVPEIPGSSATATNMATAARIPTVTPGRSERPAPLANARTMNTQSNNDRPQAANSPVGGELSGVYQVVREGLQAMQALQQQTAAAHQRFLEGQEQAHRTFQMVIESQQRMFEQLATGAPITPAPQAAPAPQTTPNRAATVRERTAPEPVAAPVPAPVQNVAATPVPAQPAPVQPAPAPKQNAFADVMLQIVSELTGYPAEMLDVSMDMEADLGIDSIKRVEILAAVQEKLPDVKQVDSAHMGSLRTLQDIIEYMGGAEAVQGAAPVAAADPVATTGGSTGSSAGFAPVLLAVVSELTGYPIEMLDVSMDMEADLGIDSIKRVEILAAVQEKLPDVKQVDSAHMGSLRTLQDIIEYMGAGVATATPAEQVTANPNAGSALPVSAPSEVVSADETQIDETTVLQRQVLAVRELTAVGSRSLAIAPGHEVWVVDDGTELAGEIVRRFVALGIAARVVGSAAPVDGEACAPVGGLVHLFPPADRAEASTVDQLKSAFALTRELAGDLRSAASEGGALLVTVSRMDGAFGLRGSDFDPVQGGLAGLAKTAAREWPDVVCRAVDVDSAWTDSAAIADALLACVASDAPVEVGLSAASRCTLALEAQTVSRGTSRLEVGDLVIVSGGARGVTAACALALAKAHRPTMLLLGRSPEPTDEPEWARGVVDESALKRAIMQHAFAGKKPSPSELQAAYRRIQSQREISQTLAQLHDAGVEATYASVDVTDKAAVRDVVRAARERFGPVRGLIHGAGVIEDRLIADKDSALFDKVFDTKVLGVQALLEAVGSDDLKCLVFFSSVTGRIGREGQVDYAMANEVLNKLAQRHAARRPHCRVVAINWGPWDGGMVTGSLKREFDRIGVELIPIDAGARAMVDELSAGHDGGVEVLVGGAFDSAAIDASPTVVADDDVEVALTRRLDVATHGFLKSHEIGGRAVLPVAVAMEWLGHAALHAHPGLRLVALEDVRVLRAAALDAGHLDIEVVCGAVERKGADCIVPVTLRSRNDRGMVVPHMQGKAHLGPQRAKAAVYTRPDGVADAAYPHDAAGIYREVLFHGPQFHAISSVEGHSARGMVAQVAVAPRPEVWMDSPARSAWLGDPLAVDAVLQLGILWCVAHRGAPSLPAFVGGYTQYVDRMPTDGATCVLTVVEASDKRLRADAAILGAGEELLAELRGVEWTIDAALANAFGGSSRAGAKQ